MINLNSYILEKLHLNKNIKVEEPEPEIEEKLISLLKKINDDVYLDDIFNYSIYTEDGDEIESIWIVNDTLYYGLTSSPIGKTFDDFSELFSLDQIEQIYNYLEKKLK